LAEADAGGGDGRRQAWGAGHGARGGIWDGRLDGVGG
jgi:hypothetical protein